MQLRYTESFLSEQTQYSVLQILTLGHELQEKERNEKVTDYKIDHFLVVEEDGFEPSKSSTTDLQSAPFGHSGTPPYEIGAGGRTRTPDLLITNQLLYQLSYTSLYCLICRTDDIYYIISPSTCQALFILFSFFNKVVEATGLEPAASWSQTKHSTKLSYAS